MVTRVAFQTDMRRAAVTMFREYAEANELTLQVYRSRPRTLYPPTAFVDRLRESITFSGPTIMRRVPTVDVVIVHAIFDSAEAAEKRDEFVDGFLVWVADRYHAAGANTLIAPVTVEDEPNFVPDWMPPDQARMYYASVISLEGLASG